MAYGMENIAGMLARGGAMTGQAIGAPLAQFGQNIGGMLTARAETQQKQTDAAEVQKLLEQNKDNPAQLNALYQKYASEGKTDLANLFKQAAESAKKKRQAFVAGQEARLERGRERAEANKDLVAGMDDELKGIKVKKAAIELARENKDSNAVKMLAKDALDPQEYIDAQFKSKGTKAKPTIKQTTEMVGGVEKNVFYSFDENNKMTKQIGGEVAPDADTSASDYRKDLGTAWGSALLEDARDDVTAAKDKSSKLSSMLTTAEQLYNKDEDIFGMPVGGILGKVRDFAISDVAGLGDEISIFRSQLNSLRMQEAMKLLPQGPASDKDVALALDGSTDFVNLSPEQKLSYIRGMQKIADAQSEYLESKVTFINSTGDPNALGFEVYADQLGKKRTVETLEQERFAEVQVLKAGLERVKTLADSGNIEAAKAEAQALKEFDQVGYLSALEDLEASRQQWDRYASERKVNTSFLADI